MSEKTNHCRPPAENIPDSIYYPHYTGWHRDPLYVKLKMSMGNDGIAIFNELQGFLAERPESRAELHSIPEIAFALHQDEAKLKRVIEDFGIFRVEDGFFSSPWLTAALLPLAEKRRRQSEGAKATNAKRWGKSVIDQLAIGEPSDTDRSRVEKSIEEKSIEEKKREDESKAEILSAFEVWWDMYDKKVDRKTAEKRWFQLTDAERVKAANHTPKYVEATPEKKYRKDPATYLNKKSFENEIIESTTPVTKNADTGELFGGRSNGIQLLGTSGKRCETAKQW